MTTVYAAGSTDADGISVVARLAAARPAWRVVVTPTGDHYARRWPAWLANVTAGPAEAALEADAVIAPAPSPAVLDSVRRALEAGRPVVASSAVAGELADLGYVDGLEITDELDGYLAVIDRLTTPDAKAEAADER